MHAWREAKIGEIREANTKSGFVEDDVPIASFQDVGGGERFGINRTFLYMFDDFTIEMIEIWNFELIYFLNVVDVPELAFFFLDLSRK